MILEKVGKILKIIVILMIFMLPVGAVAQDDSAVPPCEADARFAEFDFWLGCVDGHDPLHQQWQYVANAQD